ncbi:hypothetical protein TDB9533_00031 [Thalassocella blandensis]|nr:hypothetical protein TDB9533_00031 [Thalassocella blandensis]
MTVATTKPANQTSNNTKTDNKASPSARDRQKTGDVKKHDQLSFLEGIRGLESGIPFIAGGFDSQPVSSKPGVTRDLPGNAHHAHGSAQAGLNAPAAEDASAAMLSNTIIQKMLRDPALRNMAFSIQNKHGSVNVEAAINNGHMRCVLSSKSEKLRRRMHNAREQIINRVGGHLRMPVELNIEE